MKIINLKIDIILFSIMFINLNVFVYSQSDLDNHKKYWFYKSRLNNDFIKVGNTPAPTLTVPIGTIDGHGESIPFNERNWAEGNYGPITPSVTNDNHRVLNHGDEGTRLGLYLSVLATEYKLLKNNGQDLTTVKHEIFCALNAINRMDFWAEPALDNTKSPSLNGFFVRGDIPSHFVFDNYEHFNYYSHIVSLNDSTQDKGFTSSIVSNPVTRIDGGGIDKGFVENHPEESQDQCFYLLLGLTLTNKLVDVNDVDGSNVFGFENIGETKLVQESSNIAERIITYLKDHSNWKIKNPNTGSDISGQGGNAQAYAYALDNLGCFIKYGQDLPFYYPSSIVSGSLGYPKNNCNDFRNAYSGGPLASAAWQAIANSGGGPSADEQGFFQVLGSTSNSVFKDISLTNIDVQTQINSIQIQLYNLANTLNTQVQNILSNIPNWAPQWVKDVAQTAITLLTNATQLITNGLNQVLSVAYSTLNPFGLINTTDKELLYNTYGNQVIYYDDCLFPHPNSPISTPLIHLGSSEYFGTYVRGILHGFNSTLPSNLTWLNAANTVNLNGNQIMKSDVEGKLNDAPCEGNFNFNPILIPPGAQWGASNFMDREDHLWKKTTCSGNLGDYSGTDYMLLHNLFYLTEGTNKPIVDFISRKPITNFPNGNAFTVSNKQTFGAFEFITANNIINANGGVEYRAGKEIALLPITAGNGGFSAIQGCDFNAQILPYPCSGIGSNMNKSSANPTDDFDGENKNNTMPGLSINQTEPINENTSEINNFISDLQNLIDSKMDSINNEVNRLNALIKNYNKFEIYPNPNSGKFMVEFHLTNEENVSFTISDLIGNIILTEKYVTGTLTLPIDLSNLAKGVYIAKIKLRNGNEETKKVTIQ